MALLQPRRLSHIGVTVSDLQVAVDYYTDVLGFEMFLDYRDGVLPGHKTVIGRIGDCAVELIHDPSAGSPEADVPVRLGYSCLSFSVNDLDAALVALRARGLTEQTEPWQFPAARCVFFRDPDGNLLELIDVNGDATTIVDLA